MSTGIPRLLRPEGLLENSAFARFSMAKRRNRRAFRSGPHRDGQARIIRMT